MLTRSSFQRKKRNNLLLGFDILIAAVTIGIASALKTKMGRKAAKRAGQAVLKEEELMLKLEDAQARLNAERNRHALDMEPKKEKERDTIDEIRYQQTLELERTKLDTLKANRKLLRAESKRKLKQEEFDPIAIDYQQLPSPLPRALPPPVTSVQPNFPRADLAERKAVEGVGVSNYDYTQRGPSLGQRAQLDWKMRHNDAFIIE